MSACALAGLSVCDGGGGGGGGGGRGGGLSIFFLSPSNRIPIGILYRYDF